jgi:hypothetical protein
VVLKRKKKEAAKPTHLVFPLSMFKSSCCLKKKQGLGKFRFEESYDVGSTIVAIFFLKKMKKTPNSTHQIGDSESNARKRNSRAM